jgi:DNA-binding NarL/FixJ family response regulator
MASRANSPITVAVVDDYDVVLMGVANMFDQYRDRVVVAELDSNTAVDDAVDIVLYDSFAQAESDHEEIAVLVANPRARRVVVYTWNFHPDLVLSAQQHGAHGYLSKTLPARELVAAWRRCTPETVEVILRTAARTHYLAEGEGLAIVSRRSWPSSPRARATPRSRR